MKASKLWPAVVAMAIVLGIAFQSQPAAAGDRAPGLAVTNGYITALLRSECTSAPFPPPPVGEVAVGPDYVILTVADGDPLDYEAAQRLVTDAIFESLMPVYCALPHGTNFGCVTNRVQWNLMTYDAGGNPRVSGGPASGPAYHYCAVTNGYVTAVLRGRNAALPPPPPVGQVAVGTDSVIMTIADRNPLDFDAAKELATDLVFASLMRVYCALPRGTGMGSVSGQVNWDVATYDAGGNLQMTGCAASGCELHDCVVSQGFITALLRSDCTSAPSPPPPVGQVAVGPDYVILTVADGDPLDYEAAQRLVTDAIFESLMPQYCALPHGTNFGCVTDRVQWNLVTYDAGGNPKLSGGPASGPGFHYCGPGALTTQEGIQNLIGWVDAGVAAGILSNGGSLVAKLNAALGNVAGGKTRAALRQVNAFLGEVDVMVKTGRLAPAAAQTLRDASLVITMKLASQPP